jgi:hypothetical protein
VEISFKAVSRSVGVGAGDGVGMPYLKSNHTYDNGSQGSDIRKNRKP